MDFIKTPTKGMRDILPKEMEIREYIMKNIYETYKQYGFKKIETPAVEHIENLTSNQGGENEKLIFKILKRGEKLDLTSTSSEEEIIDGGLRYDLTVPLCRYYANNMNDLETPFKAIQMGNVWRADRPQKGRFRQFVQCDIDILGDKTNLAEIELISATAALLNKIGFNKFKIIINDRKILKALALYAGFNEEDCTPVFISLDKMDKIGLDGVKEELLKYDYPLDVVEKYLNMFSDINQDPREFCANIPEELLEKDVVTSLEQIINTSRECNNVNIEFDPTLVRGMGYYTGPIFEIKVEGYPGSIGGGGRYDEMVGKFINVNVPACGFSIGFERLIDILMEQNYTIPEEKEKIAYIIDKDVEALDKYIKEVRELRNDNKIVNIQYKSKNFKFQKETLEKQNYIIFLNGERI